MAKISWTIFLCYFKSVFKLNSRVRYSRVQVVMCSIFLCITIGNSPPREPKPYKANFYYTGIFTYFTGIEISIPVFSITIPALICYENLRIKTISLKDKFLTWLGFELNTAWKKTPLHALTNWAIGTDKKKRQILRSLNEKE